MLVYYIFYNSKFLVFLRFSEAVKWVTTSVIWNLVKCNVQNFIYMLEYSSLPSEHLFYCIY